MISFAKFSVLSAALFAFGALAVPQAAEAHDTKMTKAKMMDDCMGDNCPGKVMKKDDMMKDTMMKDTMHDAAAKPMMNDDDHGGSHMDGASMDSGMMDDNSMGGSMNDGMGNTMN